MLQIQNWGNALKGVWLNTISNIIYVVLNVIVAVLIFSLGWLFADFVASLIGKLVAKLRLDTPLKKMGFDKFLNRGGIKLNTAGFVAGVVKWIIIALFFISALQILGLDAVANFIQTILIGYLPKVMIAVLILLISIIFGETVEKIVTAISSAGHLRSSKTLGALSRWAIIVFAVLAALVELEIAPSLIQILFIGLVSTISIAFGVAFGLGGKEFAAKAIETGWQRISRRE